MSNTSYILFPVIQARPGTMSRDYLHVQLPMWINVQTVDNKTSWSRIVSVDLVEQPESQTTDAITTANGTAPVVQKSRIYDPDGAALFCVVVLSVYAISIVLFMLTIVKRKVGTKLNDENSDVTDYLMKVPALKDKAARENFKKLKISIISELKRQDSVGSSSVLIPAEYSSYFSSSISSVEGSPYPGRGRRGGRGLATTGLLMAANSMLSAPGTPAISDIESEPPSPAGTSINTYYSPMTPDDGNITPRSTVRFTFPPGPTMDTNSTYSPDSPSSPMTPPPTPAHDSTPGPSNIRRHGSARSSTSRPCVVFPNARRNTLPSVVSNEQNQRGGNALQIPELVISSC